MVRRINMHWVKVGLTGLGALAAVGAAAELVKPPPLTPVAVLTQPIAALDPVTRHDIAWVKMEHPPAGTITAWAGNPLAAHTLTPGAVLNRADFTSIGQAFGLKPDEVRYVVPIKLESAIVHVGQRVEVWSVPTAAGGSGLRTPQELATGVRVIGLYASNGQPVSAVASAKGGLLSSNQAPALPAMAALAIPESALSPLMATNPGQTVLLIQNPSQSRFSLVAPSSGTGSASPAGPHTSPAS